MGAIPIVLVFGCLESTVKTTTTSGLNAICHKRISTGHVVQFCCNNHEERNGLCIECHDGYKSIDGEPCEPCTQGWWGRKCKMKCICTEGQSCHHVTGCRKSFENTETNLDVFSWSTHIHKRKSETTLIYKLESTENDYVGDRNYTITYTISGCLAVFGFICGVACIWQRRRILKRHSSHNQSPVHPTGLQLNESFYDLIDEEAMDDENRETENNSIENLENISSSLETEVFEEEKCGYRHSYQSLGGNSGIAYYKSLKTENPNKRLIQSPENEEDLHFVDNEGYLKPFNALHSVATSAEYQAENREDNIQNNQDTILLTDIVAINEPVRAEPAVDTHIYFECVE